MANDKNVVYGRHPVMEAIDSGRQVEKIFIQRDIAGEVFAQVKKAAKAMEIPVQAVPIEKLNRITKGNHQGVVAFFSAVQYYKIEDVLPQIYERGEVPLIMLLDSVTDVRNMGAIARTAYCAGAHALVVPSKGAAPITPDAVKTSAGALNKLPVCRHQDIKEVVNILQTNGIQVVAMEAAGDKYMQEVDMKIPTAIVMGGEDQGVNTQVIRISDALVKLPMQRKFNSYNVSVAAGMVLYEVMRQRHNVG